MYQKKISKKRVTNKREAIFSFLEENKVHPTASEIYDNIRNRFPNVSRMTIYRNLDTLCQEGLVKKIQISGTTRFDLVMEDEEHDHFICKKCEVIIDLHLTNTHKEALKQIKQKYPKLNSEEVALSISGICNMCKKR